MRVRIDESRHDHATVGIEYLRTARHLPLDLVGWARRDDDTIAHEHAAIGNNGEVGQFASDARPSWSGQCDQLRRVQNSERLQSSLLCTIRSIRSNSASDSARIFASFSDSDVFTAASFKLPRLIRTFMAAPSMQARVASRPTPTSEIEAGFPCSAISPRSR